jgi:hypothetical protein
MDNSHIHKVFTYGGLNRIQKIKYHVYSGIQKIQILFQKFIYCCSNYGVIDSDDEINKTKLILLSQN